MADQMTLLNIGGGAALEKFHIELDRVVENLMDPNTAETTREINLKVKFKPVKDSDLVDIMVICTSKLAADLPYPTRAFVGRGGRGKPEIYESNPKQLGIFEQPEPAENVLKIRKEVNGND